MDRRSFLRLSAAAGLAGAGTGVGTGMAATSASAASLVELKYRALVPEIFRTLPDPPVHTQAIVIGSGFGGAITAHRLAQAGVRTTVLERGSRWPRSATREIFTGDALPDGRGFWHRRSFTGLTGLPAFFDDFGGILDVTEYDGIDVWRGACVGGGSMVFTGVMIEPERRFFDQVFAGGLDYDRMHSTYYPRVRRALRLSPMPADVYAANAFGHSRIWDAQSRTAGYSPAPIDGIWNWDVVRAELKGRARPSAIIGESNLGNGNGAKFDLNQNYLKWAEASGFAKVYSGQQVLSIGRDAAGRYLVRTEKLTPGGRVLSRQTLSCDQLYLAAGSIGTTELLVRARETGTLPRLNDHVGTGWGTNGDAAVVRSVKVGGLTQGSPSASRILDETTTPGLPVTLENWYVPGLPVDLGIIGSLGMVLDPTRADFRYDAGTGKVDLLWPKNGNDRAVAALRAVNTKIARASGAFTGAGPFSTDVNASFTAHPLGGAVLNKATDGYGRVKGYRGLYVMDGAAIPGSTGTVNPSLTISALAERNIEAIIAAKG